VDRNDPRNPANKYRTREARRELRTILMAWDPIGVGNAPEAQDEYDSLIGPLMNLLHEGVDASAIQDWITDWLARAVELPPRPAEDRAAAVSMVDWWKERDNV
jgi:hypothetical protein